MNLHLESQPKCSHSKPSYERSKKNIGRDSDSKFLYVADITSKFIHSKPESQVAEKSGMNTSVLEPFHLNLKPPKID